MTHSTDQLIGILHDAVTPEDELLARLHRRLEESPAIDIAYRTLDTSLGLLLLARTDRGLVRVAFADQGHDRALAELADRISPRVLRAPRRLDEAAEQVEDYLSGRRKTFDLPLDFALSHGFRQAVQQYLPHIAYGRTQSYGEVAAHVGHPRAARAVGTACATNPLPIVVPCHRVLPANGSVGGYAGGATAKRALLDLERPRAQTGDG